MKRLSEILRGIEGCVVTGSTLCDVSGVVTDSRKVEPGNVFVAVQGSCVDGHKFIGEAQSRGAVAVVCEMVPADRDSRVVWIECSNSAKVLGQIASRFFDEPSVKMKVVGVTGTNGKTTVATILYRLFRRLGYKVGLLSTNGYYIDEKRMAASHTTPDAVRVHSLMSMMVDAGCDYCFMEVSSHSIHQERVAGVDFDAGVFTNLTHDHLDYHNTFSEYRDSKKKFFDELKPGASAFTNIDDKNGMFMVQNTRASKFTYSLRSMADYSVRVLESHFDGMLLSVDGREVWTRLVGKFNALNILAVYGVAVAFGVREEEVLEQMSFLGSVDGRFEILRSSMGVFAIVDYAHTPDALKNVLSTINEIKGKGKLFTVVGAGGDRDREKRPEMAQEAAVASDKVIFTSDNPRSESPESIIEEMMQGVTAKQRAKVIAITDRKEAMRVAYMMAKPGDIILVAGKGHEDYQEIKGVRYHFDDRQVIREIFDVISEN